MKKVFEFEGIPSGDYEGFCFDVDKKTFIEFDGQNPDKYNVSIHSKKLFRLYPNTFFEGSKKLKIKIEVEEI